MSMSMQIGRGNEKMFKVPSESKLPCINLLCIRRIPIFFRSLNTFEYPCIERGKNVSGIFRKAIKVKKIEKTLM